MRFDLSNRTELARRVLVLLAADSDQTLKGADLAEAVGTTRHYLPQVMRPLVAAGWVDSDPGPTGGYRLLDGIDGVSVWDLVMAVERSVDDGRCVLTGEWCNDDRRCSIHDAWKKARAVLQKELERTPAIPRGRGWQ
ncbi:MAG TPA: Rrf2 family transcriptional regulator [Acidimicrobiia bacterium]|nr:Rrf2 family transcriptional regulator [Acidimicrobiia bacterium]